MTGPIRTGIVGLFALAATLSGAAASASDFTFNVPVNVSNLPAATGLRVSCSVNTGGKDMVAVGNGVGYASITGGKYSGTVVVSFDAKTTTPPASAAKYSCYLTLEGKSVPKGTYFEAGYGSLVPNWLGATGQTITGTPVSPALITGTLPGH